MLAVGVKLSFILFGMKETVDMLPWQVFWAMANQDFKNAELCVVLDEVVLICTEVFEPIPFEV